MRAMCVCSILTLATCVAFAQTPGREGAVPGEPTAAGKTGGDEPVDFEKARELFRKRQSGGQLSRAEEAYLQRALKARRKANAGNQRNVGGRDSVGLKPLSDMTKDDRYQDEEGGLYGEGRNEPPEPLRLRADAELKRIVPRNREGQADPRGKIVFISISMSNATQEFSAFKRIADADPEKSARLTIVDCAQGGQAMAEWAPPEAPPWQEAERRLAAADVSPQQVQVAWVKIANKGPRGDLKEHGGKLEKDTLAVLQNARARFPNLRIVYLSSRIYGGYSTGALNPEPYAYESAFVARWLIRDQLRDDTEPPRNELQPRPIPLLLWGPYLWADGVTARSDGLTYARDDLAGDGTHPSPSGQRKVAQQILTFCKTSPLARPWFTGSGEASAVK